jgi:hypothetical protein
VDAPTRTRPSRRSSRREPRQPVDRREPPTTDENAAGEHVGPPRRLQPAGIAFLVGLCALLLGALLNAPGLHKTAENLDPGWKRDVGLALTGPLEDVSHFLLLDRPRQAVKDAIGRPDDDKIATEPILIPPPPPVSTVQNPPPVAVTRPTGQKPAKPVQKPAQKPVKKPVVGPPPKEAFSPARPLRIYIGGDSLVITPGYALLRATGGRKVYKSLGPVDGHVATGLERPDVYNWFERISEVMRTDRPDVAVVNFGGNDDHSYMTGLPEGVSIGSFGSPEWVREYRRRVGGFMDTVIRGGGFLVWIGLPITKSASQTQRFELINRIVYQEAAKRPKGAAYLDTYTLFADPKTGGYTEYLKDDRGELVDVRAADGVHFERAGGDMVAREILRALNQQFDLTSWKRKSG